MTQTTQHYTIRRGRTEIDVPHLDTTLTFIYQQFGPNTYTNVQNEIVQANLTPPTMEETASLIHQVYQDKQGREPEFTAIKDIMKNRRLCTFTGTLRVPNIGVYVQDHPATRNNMPFMDESELVEKLEANDPTVRFVPFGFKTGTMTSRELEKNHYIVALAGEEGAEKLADVADNHKDHPHLWGFESVDQLLIRVAALDSYWGIVRRLNVDGGRGLNRIGCAFGVQKAGEASRAEK